MNSERENGGPLVQLPRLIVQHRRWIIAFWTVLLVFLLPFALDAYERLQPRAHLGTGEAAQVANILHEKFENPAGNQAILVIAGVSDMATGTGQRVLLEATAALTVNPSIVGVTSFVSTGDPMLLGEGGNGAIVIVGVATDLSMSAAMESLRRTTSALEADIQTEFPEARLYWTGELPLDHDVLTEGRREVHLAEMRALPLIFVLLLWAFGAIVAAFAPILVAVLSIILTMGVTGLVTHFWVPSSLLQNITSFLGLALGVDYALLMVSRFLEHFAHDQDPLAATEQAVRHAGKTILLSGAAVAIGFAALFIVPAHEPRSLALGGFLVTFFSVMAATTLLPAALAELGQRVNLGRISDRNLQTGRNRGWFRWGMRVTRRPILVLLCSALLLLAMAWPAQRVTISLPDEGWLPNSAESARGIEALKEMGRESLIYGLRVLFRFSQDAESLDPAGWEELVRLHRSLESDERIDRVISLVERAGPDASFQVVRDFLPTNVKDRFLGRGHEWALFDIMPTSGLKPRILMQLTRDIRSGRQGALIGPGKDIQLLVGGIPAATVDYQGIITYWFPRVVLLVISGTFLALLIGYRSLVIPTKAVLLNILSVTAAYGVMELVFLEGYGIGIFGHSGPVGGVIPAIPLLVFCTVFGISMDYEVFFLSRVEEIRRRTASESRAIAGGMAYSAGLITRAAAIMLIVFGSFAVGGFLPIQMLGFTLAVAVLLDVTLVRIALGPALLSLAGKWNWWPGANFNLKDKQKGGGRLFPRP